MHKLAIVELFWYVSSLIYMYVTVFVMFYQGLNHGRNLTCGSQETIDISKVLTCDVAIIRFKDVKYISR